MYYYRNDNGFMRGLLTPAVRFLLIANAAVFLCQIFVDPLGHGKFTFLLSLSWIGLKNLWLWQFVTYQFLHGGLMHLFLNMLGLFFFGPETERAIGTRRFTMLYLACGILGGLGWLLFTFFNPAGFCIGASGAIFGILGAFAALFPNRPVTVLVFFVLPLTMKARTLAIAMAVFSLLASVGQPGNIAYAAHLAGGLAGYAYIALLSSAGTGGLVFPGFRQMLNDLIWRWHRRKFKVMSAGESLDEEDGAPPSEKEINEVLEKLSWYGMKSLSRRELDILRRASRGNARREQ